MKKRRLGIFLGLSLIVFAEGSAHKALPWQHSSYHISAIQLVLLMVAALVFSLFAPIPEKKDPAC